MYKSPIELTYDELQTQIERENENFIMNAIRKVGVNVDKNELIKALQYDRNQYKKGYTQALKDVCDVMNDSEYPEDLEMDLYDFMKDKGMKTEKEG